MSIRKRPGLVTLPEYPTVLKISEIPAGVWILRINKPFDLTRLAKTKVENAFIVARTGKSARTLIGKETAQMLELKRAVEDIVTKRFPILVNHLHISVTVQLSWGHTEYKEVKADYYYCSDLPKLADVLDDCGFSQIPLKAFMVPLEEPRHQWIHFQSAKDAFIATQIGKRPYDAYTAKELIQLIKDNMVLQRLKCYVCETAVATGKWITCKTPVWGPEEEYKVESQL